MRSTLLFVLCLTLATGCGGGNDNASPHTHGAKNDPSKGGETRSNTPPPGNPDTPPPTPGGEGTYAESGANAGGQQTTTR
ncbi:MAG TPA: hypothetical protein VF911_07030 [Thermoanaerobaculia bacterium]|jgi:hypothetical protein